MPPPVSMAETSAVYMAASVIRNAKRPLLIIGKGSSEWNSKSCYAIERMLILFRNYLHYLRTYLIFEIGV